MPAAGDKTVLIKGPAGNLPVKFDDKISRQLAMLFEGKCLGLGPSKAAQKYGYSKQRFFQLLNGFVQDGSKALVPKKTGPKKNYVRTDSVVAQIIRHRFLDPDAKAEVIAQKLKQTGVQVSQRTVERTITEYGLQKKTLQVSAQRRPDRD
jgi:hypothetical protein